MPDARRHPHFIFVTGGVVSSLGKGIASASIGRLLVARGLSVQLQKLTPISTSIRARCRPISTAKSM